LNSHRKSAARKQVNANTQEIELYSLTTFFLRKEAIPEIPIMLIISKITDKPVIETKRISMKSFSLIILNFKLQKPQF
jgi:hypothetical protein